MAVITKVHNGKTYIFEARIYASVEGVSCNCGMSHVFNVCHPTAYINSIIPTVDGIRVPKDVWGNWSLDPLEPLLYKEDVLEILVEDFIIQRVHVGKQVFLSAPFNVKGVDDYWTYNFMYYLYTHQPKFGTIVFGDGSVNKNHLTPEPTTTNHFIQAALWIPSLGGEDLSIKVDLDKKTFKIPDSIRTTYRYNKEWQSGCEAMGLGALQAPPSPSASGLGDLYPGLAPPEEKMKPKETPVNPAKENEISYNKDLKMSKPKRKIKKDL